MSDYGQADPQVREAIARYATDQTKESATGLLAALRNARLLTPVVSDDQGQMTSVQFDAFDGRTALLAFTGIDALTNWRKDARPVAREAHLVAADALEHDVDAVLVDFQGPVRIALEGALLVRLAVGSAKDRLHDVLDDVCQQLQGLPTVARSWWQQLPGAIEVSIAAVPTESLAAEVTRVMKSPDLAVVLDQPLEVRLVPDFGDVPPLG